MKKQLQRLLSITLVLAMALSAVPTQAVGTKVRPTPPSWVDEDEYMIFTDEGASNKTRVYELENWNQLQALRTHAEAGNALPSPESDPELYEIWSALYSSSSGNFGSSACRIFERLLLALQYYNNVPDAEALNQADNDGAHLVSYVWTGEENTRRYNLSTLWYARVCALLYTTGGLSEDKASVRLDTIDRLLLTTPYTMDDLYNCPLLWRITPQQWSELDAALSQRQQSIAVCLDNYVISSRSKQLAEIRNDRTMLPLYIYSDKLGADIQWDGATRSVICSRAGTQVVLQIDSKTALVNGQPIQMDVAPYIHNDRTMLPAAYIAQFFGQTVHWDADLRAVRITEDKSVIGSSNLERWALPMGAMLDYIHFGRNENLQIGVDSRFGILGRGYTSSFLGAKTSLAQNRRDMLLSGWSINSRSALIDTVLRMTPAGHNASFLYDCAYINSLSTAEYKKLLSQAQGIDAYMFPFTKQLSEKWGERGILCWDLFRMSNLVQWGYDAGYVTYAEALVLLEPAITLLRENFSSWDEAYENYLDGYHWWAREDVLGQSTWESSRGQYYLLLKEQDQLLNDGAFFDDDLFKTAIIPVPGLTIDDILATLE